MGRTADEIEKVFAGFERKIKTTEYLTDGPNKLLIFFHND